MSDTVNFESGISFNPTPGSEMAILWLYAMRNPFPYADNEMITVGITGPSVPGISDESGEIDLEVHQG